MKNDRTTRDCPLDLAIDRRRLSDGSFTAARFADQSNGTLTTVHGEGSCTGLHALRKEAISGRTSRSDSCRDVRIRVRYSRACAAQCLNATESHLDPRTYDLQLTGGDVPSE